LATGIASAEEKLKKNGTIESKAWQQNTNIILEHQRM
jgi:hypothetical protein